MCMFSVSISYYSYLLYEEACHNNRWKSQVWAKPLCFKNNPFSCFNIFIYHKNSWDRSCAVGSVLDF